MSKQTEALEDLGRYIRAQRELAHLSVRHLARISNVSDSYLSQVERGLYQPSADVLKAISTALRLAPEELFRRSGWLDTPEETRAVTVPQAINADTRLSSAEKAALIQMYETMVGDS